MKNWKSVWKIYDNLDANWFMSIFFFLIFDYFDDFINEICLDTPLCIVFTSKFSNSILIWWKEIFYIIKNKIIIKIFIIIFRDFLLSNKTQEDVRTKIISSHYNKLQIVLLIFHLMLNWVLIWNLSDFLN